MVWALCVSQTAAWGTIYYSFSLYVGPMRAELGWSVPALNGALTLGLLTWGLAAYSVGAWIDKHGGRALMTCGSLLGALALALWSQVESLPAFYAIYALMGLAMAMLLYDPAFAVVTAAFKADAPKAITAITLAGGFASTIFMPLTHLLVETLGWRESLLALAAVNLLLGAAIHAAMLPRKSALARDASETPPAGDKAPVSDKAAFRAATRTRAFWGLMLWQAAYSAGFGALTFHIIPLLDERGVAMTTALAVIAIIGPMQVAGRIALALAKGKATMRRIGPWVAATLPLAIAIFTLLPTEFVWLALFAAIYGAGNGITTILRGIAVPELIGRQAYGAINGALIGPANFAKAAAPLSFAAAWTWGGQTTALWILLAVACLGVAGCLLAVKR
ncbi:MAG: MFS transporter [Alphaproteobacteria bacterium]